ncbi:MAG: hypothetical protein SFY92_06895 [Verrucomicrobiae bacterium]|nr:hypothetical protein [Verrucomicrobiae bacterium]
MRRILFLGFLLLLTGVFPLLHAQVGVRLEFPRNEFLTYETIPAEVTLHNNSAETVTLRGTEMNRWLNFRIRDNHDNIIARAGDFREDKDLVLEPGQQAARIINLTRLYGLRRPGRYSVRAEVTANNTTVSPSKFIFIEEGIPLRRLKLHYKDTETGKNDVTDVTLIEYPKTGEPRLYLRMESDTRNAVLCNISLMPLLMKETIQTQVDGESNLHILFRTGPRAFGYVAFDCQGRPIALDLYTNTNSNPSLKVTENREVLVEGGTLLPKEKNDPIPASRNPQIIRPEAKKPKN